jgi:hypothetical protein
MKKTLKLGMLAFAMLFATSLMAQPPVPGGNGSTGTTPTPEDSINRSHNTPVGTATLLMLGMGGAFLGYKVKKSKKENKD